MEKKETGLMMSRGTYLCSTVSFWASSFAAAAAGIEFRCGLPPRLCAATGGNALINTDCPSLTAGRSVSLMVLGAPALPRLPEEPID